MNSPSRTGMPQINEADELAVMPANQATKVQELTSKDIPDADLEEATKLKRGLVGVPIPPPAKQKHQHQEQGVRQRSTAAMFPSIERMVKHAHSQQASDIHIRVGEVPRYRIRSQMVPVGNHDRVTPEIFRQYLNEILTPDQFKKFHETKELDSAIYYPGFLRCRVNCFETLTGGAIVLRLIPLEVPSIESLGLPPVLRSLVKRSQGLILVTGPTGSGKSTTLAAMIRHMNETQQKHIITIEDPIEFVHASQKCLVSQREIGLHTYEFHDALRGALREDPDAILIGEMRDRLTVDTALKAAQTGHLVFGTLHTRSALSAINRLLGIYNPDEQPAMRIQMVDSLVAIIAQDLLQTTDGKRTAAHEILINTPAMQDYLMKGNEEEAYHLIENGVDEGMQVLNQALCDLLLMGKISGDEALKISPDVGDLRRRVRNEGADPARASRDYNDQKTGYSPI